MIETIVSLVVKELSESHKLTADFLVSVFEKILIQTGPAAHSPPNILQGFKVPVSNFVSLSIFVRNMEFNDRVRKTRFQDERVLLVHLRLFTPLGSGGMMIYM
jgi:hypothetical protein